MEWLHLPCFNEAHKYQGEEQTNHEIPAAVIQPILYAKTWAFIHGVILLMGSSAKAQPRALQTATQSPAPQRPSCWDLCCAILLSLWMMDLKTSQRGAESWDYPGSNGESFPYLPSTPEWLSWLPHAASFPPNDVIAWDQIPRCYHKKFTHVHFTTKGSSVFHVIYINVPSAITRTATLKSKNFNPVPEDYRFLKHLLVLSW